MARPGPPRERSPAGVYQRALRPAIAPPGGYGRPARGRWWLNAIMRDRPRVPWANSGLPVVRRPMEESSRASEALAHRTHTDQCQSYSRTIHTMRRWTLRTLLCLILGAITTVAVAWALAAVTR